LRHTFGMNLRRAGTDWPVIARLMGHASIVTTMTHYGTPAEKDPVKAMNRHGHGEDD
jgi:integrase